MQKIMEMIVYPQSVWEWIAGKGTGVICVFAIMTPVILAAEYAPWVFLSIPLGAVGAYLYAMWRVFSPKPPEDERPMEVHKVYFGIRTSLEDKD